MALLYVLLICVGTAIAFLTPKIRRDYARAGMQFTYEMWLLALISAVILINGVYGLLNEYLHWAQNDSVAFFVGAVFAAVGAIVVTLFEYRGIDRLREIAEQDLAN